MLLETVPSAALQAETWPGPARSVQDPQTVSAGTSTTTPITEAAPPPPCWGRLQPDPSQQAQRMDGVHSPLGNTHPAQTAPEPQRVGLVS